jgi:hypothetical protein
MCRLENIFLATVHQGPVTENCLSLEADESCFWRSYNMIFSNTNHPFISPSYWFIRFVSEIQRKNLFKRLISSIKLVMFHDLHFLCTTGSLTRATRPVPQVDQELLLCPVHPSSSPVFNGLRSLGFLCSVL